MQEGNTHKVDKVRVFLGLAGPGEVQAVLGTGAPRQKDMFVSKLNDTSVANTLKVPAKEGHYLCLAGWFILTSRFR